VPRFNKTFLITSSDIYYIMNTPRFEPLGTSTSLYTPPAAASGHLIILATWLGAASKHITKYTTAYAELAPTSRILLVQTPVAALFQTYAARRQALRSAVKVIRALCEECGDARPHILLHAFSNAGALTVATLSHIFSKEYEMPLPVVGVIFDSSFAKGGYKQNYNSSLDSLPAGLMFKIAGPPIANVMILLQELSIAIGRYERPEEYLRKGWRTRGRRPQEDLLHCLQGRHDDSLGRRSEPCGEGS
jgi:hypothetical protein